MYEMAVIPSCYIYSCLLTDDFIIKAVSVFAIRHVRSYVRGLNPPRNSEHKYCQTRHISCPRSKLVIYLLQVHTISPTFGVGLYRPYRAAFSVHTDNIFKTNFRVICIGSCAVLYV